MEFGIQAIFEMGTAQSRRILTGSQRYWTNVPHVAFQGLRYLSSFDSRYFKDGWAFPPASVNLEMTARCNLRCPMCWLWGERSVGPSLSRDEMTLDELKRIIDQIARWRPAVYLTGGEILSRKDTFAVMRYLAEKKLIFGFTTNATLIDEAKAAEIVRHAGAVSISLDGPEVCHDEIRGEGNFQRALRGIRLLVNARGKSPLPVIKVNTLWQKLSADELTELFEVVGALGVDALKLSRLQFISAKSARAHKAFMKKHLDTECSGIDSYVDEPDLDIDGLWDRLQEARSRVGAHWNGNGNGNGIGRGLKVLEADTREDLERWYDGHARDVRKECLFPWFSVHVMASGEVIPCGEYRQHEYVVGNLREQSFKSVWNGEKMRKFRTTLGGCGFFPGCDRCCGLTSFAK